MHLQIPNLLPVLIASRKRGARTRLKIAILNKFLQRIASFAAMLEAFATRQHLAFQLTSCILKSC